MRKRLRICSTSCHLLPMLKTCNSRLSSQASQQLVHVIQQTLKVQLRNPMFPV